MIRLARKATGPVAPGATLALNLDQRVKSRLRVVLDDGREAGIFLDRGESLKDGDCLVSDEGLVVRIQAASECLSTVESQDPHLLARACYHLGNRHVALQIETGRLRYLHDHVLDEMVRGLGLEVKVENAPFEPEPGAYGGTGHGQGHHGH
jgi:urease accessory protein